MPISFSVFLFHCEENQTQEDQQRSIRVHRVSDRDFPKTDFSQIKNSIKEVMIKQALILEGEEFEKLLTDFPNLGNLSQLFKELNAILMELIRGGAVTLKNIDLEISEMMDATTSSVLKTNKTLENILDSLKQADVYQQDVQENESQENSRIPTQIEAISELELKTMKNLLGLDNVLMEIQKHLTFVRSVFDRLCRVKLTYQNICEAQQYDATDETTCMIHESQTEVVLIENNANASFSWILDHLPNEPPTNERATIFQVEFSSLNVEVK
ncbi:hypothetical protein WN51_00620 [Melipona quadrifasciata]|uniref:Uncharacterized protein n=1 Tax=Melipona quadrifasciata TaxID=166423 RepID=A0A0M9A169_9HYME|nr:hypothetical protein WN51_00620 [Melipona quadrifasciata]